MEIEKYPSRMDGRKFFCSNNCRAVWQSKNQVGKNHHQYVKREEHQCPNCNSIFTDFPSRERTYCSEACADESKTELMGRDNPNWRGGHTTYYGQKWEEIREQVRQRDGNECRLCGAEEENLSSKPAVHHIVPVRKFDSPEAAHMMHNMIQLCQSCHMEVEQMSEKKQRGLFGFPSISANGD